MICYATTLRAMVDNATFRAGCGSFRAGLHVAAIDAPAFLREVTIVAAGEFGHAL